MVVRSLRLISLVDVNDYVALVFELGDCWVRDLQGDLRVLGHNDAHVELVVFDAQG